MNRFRIFARWLVLPLGAALLYGCRSEARKTQAPGKSRTTVIQESAPAHARSNGNPARARGDSTNRVHSQGAIASHSITTDTAFVVFGRVTNSSDMPVTSGTVKLTGYQEPTDNSTELVETVLGETSVTATGDYHIAGPLLSILGLQASADGYSKMECWMYPKGGRSQFGRPPAVLQATRIRKDIHLLPGSFVQGRVLDERDRPVAGAPVTCVTRNEPETVGPSDGISTSSETGEFRIEPIAPGARMLRVEAKGYVPFEGTVTAPSTEPFVVHLSSGGARVTGHVYRKEGHAPVSSATVALQYSPKDYSKSAGFSEFHGVTDAAGHYEVDHLPAGRYWIDCYRENLGMARRPSSEPVLQLSDQQTTEVDFQLYGGYTLSGVVFDQETSSAIAGASLRAVSSGLRRRNLKATSGGDGSYRISGIFPYHSSNATLEVYKDGYKLAGSDRDRLTVDLDPDELAVQQPVPMLKSVTVSGQVQTMDKQPVATAKVNVIDQQSMYGSDESAVPVDANGHYTIESRPFANVRVQATAPGFAKSYSETITLTGNSIQDVNVTMPAGATVRGKVIDPGGTPIPNVEVFAGEDFSIGYSNSVEIHGRTTTGDNGTFMLQNLPGRPTLQAKAEKFAPSVEMPLVLTPGQVIADFVLQLRTPHFISGKIVDKSGKVQPGWNISASSEDKHDNSSGSTNADVTGAYKISLLGDGPLVVSAYPPNGGNNIEQHNVQVDRTDVDFVVDGSTQVTLIGHVVDEKSGQAVASFTVSGLGSVKLDASQPGVFRCANLERGGNYSASIDCAGYPRTAIQVDIPRDGDSSTMEQEFKLSAGGAVRGRAVDRATGKPMPGVRVQAWESEFTDRSRTAPDRGTLAGDDGTFVLEPLAKGEQHIVLLPPGERAQAEKVARVTSGQTVDLGDIPIGDGARIQGRVVRSTGDAGVPDVPVNLQAYNGGTNVMKYSRTDASGNFAFTALAPLSYALKLPDYQELTKEITLNEDQVEEVTLRLGSSAVTVHVTRNGQPVGAKVRASSYSNNESRSGTANAQGSITFENMSPGPGKVYAAPSSEGYGQVEKSIDIPQAGTCEVSIDLPAGKISGRVVTETGEVVGQPRVLLHEGTEPVQLDDAFSAVRFADSDSTGHFSIDGLSAGSYSISAQTPKQGSAVISGVMLPENGSVDVTLRLKSEGGTIESVILNLADGLPVRNAALMISGANGFLAFAYGSDAIRRIPNIPAGSYHVRASAYGFNSSEHTAEVKAGETLRFEDVLYKASQLTWKLKDKSSVPIAGASCTVTPLDASSTELPHQGTTNAGGAYTVSVAAGAYQLSASIPGHAAVTDRVEVQANRAAFKETVAE